MRASESEDASDSGLEPDAQQSSRCHAELLSDAPAMENVPQRSATALDLWAMGVGAVISGDFFGWQATLASGFGSALVAVCLAGVLYLVLATSVAEVASIKGTGAGPCQFAQACFGRHVAFFTGLAETLKCVVALGVTTSGIASYLGEILGFDPSLSPLCWLVSLTMFTVLNIIGGTTSRKSQVVITCTSLLLLVVFYSGALVRGVDLKHFALGEQPLTSTLSLHGVFSALPFALWFFLGIEELPLAMEITVDPQRNMPRALILSLVTLVLLAFATLILSSSIPPGAKGMAKTTYPLLEGYRYAFGDTGPEHWCWLILVVGLISSQHSFIFATGQLVSQMATDSYFPAFLGRRSSFAGTPLTGLLASSSSAFAVVVLLYLLTGGDTDGLGCVAISMCLFSTLLSYAVQLCCFLHLRLRLPEARRPFRSPFGAGGAVAGLALCAASLAAVLALPALLGRLYFVGLALAAGALAAGTAAREATWHCARQAEAAAAGAGPPGGSWSGSTSESSAG